MQCPVCPNVMLTISERQGIEIDFCPTCRGVWLDRGELDKIIERTSTSSNSSTPKHHAKPETYSTAPYKKKKKDTFLEDIFDF